MIINLYQNNRKTISYTKYVESVSINDGIILLFKYIYLYLLSIISRSKHHDSPCIRTAVCFHFVTLTAKKFTKYLIPYYNKAGNISRRLNALLLLLLCYKAKSTRQRLTLARSDTLQWNTVILCSFFYN